jgi:predicted dehydrogenase
MTPVRFGLVGYGFGGRYFHAPLIASAQECELVAVMTTSPQRQALVAKEHPGVLTVGSFESLVDLGVEAVAISTPADTHSALTDQALTLGLATVCDKPFALNAEAARRTVELAERLELALSPYQNRRWDSDFLTVRKLVDDGDLGTVKRFESRFERYAPTSGPPVSGGGTLLDFGSHLVDQALTLLGPVTGVYAELRIRESGLDDDVFLGLTHQGGAHSHLSGGWRQFAAGPRFRVTGTEGTYVLAQGDTQEDRLVAAKTPASMGDRWGLEPATNWGSLYRASGSDQVETVRGAWDGFYPAFALAVRGAGPLPVEPRDAVATAMVLDAAKVSAASAGVVIPAPL